MASRVVRIGGSSFKNLLSKICRTCPIWAVHTSRTFSMATYVPSITLSLISACFTSANSLRVFNSSSSGESGSFKSCFLTKSRHFATLCLPSEQGLGEPFNFRQRSIVLRLTPKISESSTIVFANLTSPLVP